MLRTTVLKLHPLTEEELAQLAAIRAERTYAKGEHLLYAGDVCRGLFFVESGAVGLYGLRDGKEVFQDFFLPGTFATDITSLAGQSPATLFLRALEPTTVAYIRRDDLLELYAKSEGFQHFGRKVLEGLLVARTNHSVRQTTLSARERYDDLTARQPELLERIPLQYLATYLGMTRETLSRARRKK